MRYYQRQSVHQTYVNSKEKNMIIAALQLKYRKKLFSFLIKTVNVTALIQKKKKKKELLSPIEENGSILVFSF